MSTPLTLAFIAAVGAGAGYLAQRETVADGRVMAADLLGELKVRGYDALTCDDRIPIGAAGAVFRCRATRPDGSTAVILYTLDRDAKVDGKVVESSGSSEPGAPPSSDPWAL